MYITCVCCGARYDDTYRDTGCPHASFNMHTHVGGMVRSGAANDNEPPVYEEYVVTSLDDLHTIQEHLAGRDTPSFARIEAQTHVHTRDMQCLSPNTSGRLSESP